MLMKTMIDSNHIGKCCEGKGKLIALYNGAPAKNYSVILCDKHAREPPFNENILKVTLLEENEG